MFPLKILSVFLLLSFTFTFAQDVKKSPGKAKGGIVRTEDQVYVNTQNTVPLVHLDQDKLSGSITMLQNGIDIQTQPVTSGITTDQSGLVTDLVYRSDTDQQLQQLVNKDYDDDVPTQAFIVKSDKDFNKIQRLQKKIIKLNKRQLKILKPILLE